jgi:hypothetical protein
MQVPKTISFARTFEVIDHPLFKSISRYYITPGSTNGVAYKEVFIAKTSDKLWHIGLQTLPDKKHPYQLYILTNITTTKKQLREFLAPYTDMNPNSKEFKQQKRIVRFLLEKHALILEHVGVESKKIWGKEITWDKYILSEVVEQLSCDDLVAKANEYAKQRNNGKINY